MSILGKAVNLVSENPKTAICYGISAANLVMVAAPALVAAPVLGAAGFGAQGIAAGSAAAAAQSAVGNVMAPSLLSILTSAGAGGSGAVIVNGVIQAGCGIAATAFAGAPMVKRWFKGGEDDQNHEEPEPSDRE